MAKSTREINLQKLAQHKSKKKAHFHISPIFCRFHPFQTQFTLKSRSESEKQPKLGLKKKEGRHENTTQRDNKSNRTYTGKLTFIPQKTLTQIFRQNLLRASFAVSEKLGFTGTLKAILGEMNEYPTSKLESFSSEPTQPLKFSDFLFENKKKKGVVCCLSAPSKNQGYCGDYCNQNYCGDNDVYSCVWIFFG